MAYGQLGHVGISFQDSFGTEMTTSYDWFPIVNESVTENIPPIIQEGMTGRFDEGDSFEGAHDIGGDIVMEAHPVLLGKLLQAWTHASCDVTSQTGPTYLHKFQPATADFDALSALQPLTLEIHRDAGSSFLYYDCLCNGISIEIAHGAIVRGTMSVLGGKYKDKAKSSPSYLIGSEFTWNQTSVSFAGAAINGLSNLTITGDNGLEGKGTLDGTRTFNRIKRSGYRTMEMAGTILFENDTEKNAFINQTEQKVVVTVVGQEISSGWNATFIADLPSVRHNDFPVNIGGVGLIEVGFSSAVKYNSGSGTLAEFTLQNTRAFYAV